LFEDLDLERKRHRPFPTERKKFASDASSEPASTPGPKTRAMAPPVSKSLLGLDRPTSEIPVEEPAPEETGKTMLGLDPRAKSRTARPASLEDQPIFETLERKPFRPIPVERSVLFSIGLHIAAVVLFLLAPKRKIPEEGSELIPAFFAPPDSSVPIFRESPGRERPNPKRSELSDKDRIASGGDPAKPKADTPFVPDRPGREALAPGAPVVSPPRGSLSAAEEAQRQAAAAAQQQPAPKAESGQEPFVIPPNGQDRPAGGQRLANLQGAIRQAARGVSQQTTGEGGSGFPNPDGGFVDNGPLSFDTSWYDWGPYAAEMVRRIKLHWEIPELARLGWKGRVTIRFYIRGDGRVEGATILSVSGVPPFDHAALQAILTSSPFRPLPKDLGSDREGVTVTFFYNLRPEDSKGQEGGSH
jgi:TonB family protein